MLLTGKLIRRVLIDPNSTDPVLVHLRAMLEKMSKDKPGCKSCNVPDEFKLEFYISIRADKSMLEYVKKYYNVQSLEMYFFNKETKQKELYSI